MLRLDLKDSDDTVLFVDPVNGIEIHKIADRLFMDERERYGLRLSFATCGSCELMHTVVWYSDSESRDTAYDYVLAEITTYLFPQIDPVIDIPENDSNDSPDSVTFTYNGTTKHCLSCKSCDCQLGCCSLKSKDIDLHDPACECYEPF